MMYLDFIRDHPLVGWLFGGMIVSSVIGGMIVSAWSRAAERRRWTRTATPLLEEYEKIRQRQRTQDREGNKE